jgi:two-component system, cell cycle sensor histidine kinase and response regulator CckA
VAEFALCGIVFQFLKGRLMGVNVLQILFLEDSENDLVLLLAELRRNGYDPVFERVETRDDFLAALKKRLWDAVIADYVLPQFSGPEALKLFRSQGFEMPFIVVSGVFGEEKAVTMMKAGANDYIMKGNLSRLVPALERELDSAQERRSRKRAEGAMQFLAAIVESSEDAIFGMNLDSIIVSWNPAAERLFGHAAEEIIGRSMVTLFPEDHRDEMLDILASIRRGDTVGIRETKRRHKGGRIVPVSVTISPIRSSSGEIIGASSIARDISAQKQAAFERQQLLQNLDAASQQLRALSGLLPICATCKRIRDDHGYWQQIETYISKHSDAIFSHSICPQCAEEYERHFEYKLS